MLAGIQLTQPPAAVRTTTLQSMTGDAFLNIRKNKLIPSYDLEVRVEWTGELTDGEGVVVGTATGKLHLPHIGGTSYRTHARMGIYHSRIKFHWYQLGRFCRKPGGARKHTCI